MADHLGDCVSCGLDLDYTDNHIVINRRLHCLQIACWIEVERYRNEHCTECWARLPSHVSDCVTRKYAAAWARPALTPLPEDLGVPVRTVQVAGGRL
jgi:hypothetical protein